MESECSQGLFQTLGAWVHFLGQMFSKKGHFACLHPPNQMSFLTISNENIFFEGTRLGVIIAPNKGLEQALAVQLCLRVSRYKCSNCLSQWAYTGRMCLIILYFQHQEIATIGKYRLSLNVNSVVNYYVGLFLVYACV